MFAHINTLDDICYFPGRVSLVNVMKVVSGAGDTVKLIENLIQVAYNMTQADRVSMFLVENNVLVSTVSKDAKGLTLSVKKGIVGAVATSNRAINIQDAYNDESPSSSWRDFSFFCFVSCARECVGCTNAQQCIVICQDLTKDLISKQVTGQNRYCVFL